MKKLKLKQLIKEEIYKIFEEEEDAQVTGQIRVDLFDKLNIPNFDRAKFGTTINLVKKRKPLNLAATKILADVMTAMIITDDDSLLTKIFANLKQIEAK